MTRPTLTCATLATLISIPPLAAQSTPDDDMRLALRRSPVVEVVESRRDAVVNISASEIVRVRNRFGFESIFDDIFDMPRRREARPPVRRYTRDSVGSGFIIHEDGYVVTNAHVVARAAEQKVIFGDGREYDADVIAYDTEHDVALLKIDAEPAQAFPTLPLGRSDDLMIGETVIAIGNPLGLQHTVTSGVISAIGRDLHFSNDVTLHGLIQTDASINPGNSGGPLLNVLGELIGVNTAIRGDAQNIGFAIPVDQLRIALPELLDLERRYEYIAGVDVEMIDTPVISTITENSPADRAGLRVGDVVRSVDGRPVSEGVDFYIAMIGRRPGDDIAVTIMRGDETITRSLTLDTRPRPDGRALARRKLGISVLNVPEDVARELGLREQRGLLITDVEQDGPAEQLGLRARDVLVSLGKRYVSSTEELGQLLEVSEAGEVVQLSVLRVEPTGRRRGIIRLSGRLRIR